MGQLVRTLRRLVHWSGRVRVRVADTGPVVPVTRHLIEDWLLDQAPDLRPVLQTGQTVEILVLHHTRSCGAAGPVVPALTEQLAGLTRIAVGRYRPGPGQWQPV